MAEDWREVGSDEGASTNTSSSSTGHPELRIIFCAPKCLSSLDARVTSTWLGEIGSWDFLCRKSALRLKFLLCVEGLFLFTAFAAECKVSLVSNEKVKVEPMVSEKVKALFWLASAWQKAKHWEVREDSSSHIVAAAIFTFSSELRKLVQEFL